jgi:hypothetical protein
VWVIERGGVLDRLAKRGDVVVGCGDDDDRDMPPTVASVERVRAMERLDDVKSLGDQHQGWLGLIVRFEQAIPILLQIAVLLRSRSATEKTA